MFKTSNIIVFFAFLLSCANSLNSFDSEKTFFTPDQKEIYSNELKDEIPEVKIEFMSEDETMIVGDKGVLIFKTNFNDSSKFDLSTIETDSLFTTIVIDLMGDDHKVPCKLWIRSDSKFNLFCNMNGQNFEKGENYIEIKGYSFDHNNMKVQIAFSKTEFKIEQLDYSIPYLYSERQIININDEPSYELKFKKEVYNNEPLYIYGSNNNYANLDSCEVSNQELICTLTKEKIEEFLVQNNEQFNIGAMHEKIGILSFDNVLDITINYENVERQDIYLEIKEIIGGATRKGVPFGLVTNVTEIPNFISAKFDDMKYFKKVTGRPLILFYNYDFDIDYKMKSNYTKEVEISNIHYKYNFKIQPSEFEGNISVSEKGSNILLLYPKELIYTDEEGDKEETFKIMYIMNEPELSHSLRLVDVATYNLKCINLNKMKICDVPKSHFEGKQSGNYYTIHYHKSYYRLQRLYYDSSPIKVTKPFEINIISDYIDIFLGDKGKLYLKTDYNDTELNIFDDSNIEENTQFTLSFSSGEVKYSDISCHLWKNTENITFIFCQLVENLDNNNNHIIIDKTKFYYNELEVNIKQLKYIDIKFVQLEKPIPFIYSKSQTINLEEGKNIYNFTFNVENYHNEILIVKFELGSLILDKCSSDKKELVCPVDKSELEEYYFHYLEYRLYYPFPQGYLIPIRMIDKITININSPKIDLKITITKLLENYIDLLNTIAYEIETNVTNITNLQSDIFALNFEDGKIIFSELCYFKKTNENPLYLLCLNEKAENSPIYLSEIKEEMILNDIHSKYNFNIQPIKNNDKISIDEIGGKIAIAIPKSLDFSNKDEISINLLLYGYKNETANGIRFNLDANEDLVCEDSVSTHIKSCLVPKSHFENKKSGYYNLYHLNHMNKHIRYYEYSPIQVTLPKELIIRIKDTDENNPIITGRHSIVFFETEFEDIDNVFNESETEIAKQIMFSNSYDHYMGANCRLWKPKEGKLSLICDFNGNMGIYKIKLKEFTFEYKDYKVTILSKNYLYIAQINVYIPVLYSDKQEINIIDNNEKNLEFEKEIYELKFKIEVYNNEPLYIYGSNNNYANLDNCEKNDKELICNITKEKIEEILAINNEQFKVGAMKNEYGIILFDNIQDITIKFENVQRQDIYLEIKEIIGGDTRKGIPFGLVTNVTEIPNLISAKFDDMKYFKKVASRPLILFYNYDFEIDYIMKSNYTKEVIISDIHYKYNFRIQPSQFEGRIKVSQNGSNVLLSYPQELIYDDQDEAFQIIFIMNEPKLETITKLLQYTQIYPNNFECDDLNKMKICSISKSYFDRLQSGNYYPTHYHNYQSRIYYDSSPIKVTLPLKINIYDYSEYEQIYIGNKGKLYLKTYYNDTDPKVFNDDNIEENTKFNLSLSCGEKNYEGILCNFWKNTENVVYIFCQLKENLNNNDNYINIKETKFIYNNLEIPISQKDKIYFVQLEKSIPFFYSKSQTINLEEGKNTYNLKFNVENYHNEKIIIRRNQFAIELFLDKCSAENNILTCSFDKSELGGNYFDRKERDGDMNFYVYYPYINSTGEPLIPISNIDKVLIKKNTPKIDLKIRINTLLSKYIDDLNFYAYKLETDVINISNLESDFFMLNFEHDSGPRIHQCYFKKSNNNPLYLLCYNEGKGNDTFLSEIKEEMVLNNIHDNYNFYIQPVNNTEKIYVKGQGDRFTMLFPTILDFTANENFIIYFSYYGYEVTKSIRLNLNAKEDLVCEKLESKIQFVNEKESVLRCIVPKSHFDGKQNGYYNTYHLNHMNNYIQFYEISPIKVILTKDDGKSDEGKSDEGKSDGGSETPTSNKSLVGIIVGSVLGGLALIAAIVIIIIVVKKRKKDSSGINGNILPNSNQVELVEGDKFGN